MASEKITTTSALSVLLDDVLLARDQSTATVSVFLDFRKAFETINHDILAYKLNKSGLGNRATAFIRNYLKNRQQRTVLNSITSTLKTVTTGVPQGSTLGPLLFLLYINDLPKAMPNTSNMFADDTVVYMSGITRSYYNR